MEEWLGKTIKDVINNKFEYEPFSSNVITLKTVFDESYEAKNKFVIECPKIIRLAGIRTPEDSWLDENPNFTMDFDVFDVPTGVEKIFFSMKYKPGLSLGNYKLTIIQLKNDINDYLNDNYSYDSLEDYIVGKTIINMKADFIPNTQIIQKELELSEETNQLLVRIEAVYMSVATEWAVDYGEMGLRKYYNDLFSVEPGFEMFMFQEDANETSLYRENFYQKRITYFMSETEPPIPNINDLDNFDFSNVWLCEENIYDENDELKYEKNSLYGLRTNLYFAPLIGNDESQYSVVGWKKLNITKEQIDAGYEHPFFVGYSFVKEFDRFLNSGFYNAFQSEVEFGDIMFSTINYEWAPAEGENAIDTEFRFNKSGMYIDNNEEGFRREISASRDISTNLQTGENTWFLTPQGQWVKLLEAKEIRIGNFHIVEEDDEINFYYRGGG